MDQQEGSELRQRGFEINSAATKSRPPEQEHKWHRCPPAHGFRTASIHIKHFSSHRSTYIVSIAAALGVHAAASRFDRAGTTTRRPPVSYRVASAAAASPANVYVLDTASSFSDTAYTAPI